MFDLRWLRMSLAPLFLLATAGSRADEPGAVPKAEDGRPLNLGFESGTLQDWQAEGPAFQNGPVDGDTVKARRPEAQVGFDGRYWAGSFEAEGDVPTGTLTSVPFVVDHPWASFLVGGGSGRETFVELIRVDTGKPFYRVSGTSTEDMTRVAVDLKDHQNKSIQIRLVDNASGPWGHVNYDDFRFHDAEPDVPSRDVPTSFDVYAHAGLSPQEAADAMTLPEGFHVSVFAGEPDVVQPIALSLDDRGRVWVAEAYSYPIKVAPEDARDRILIFEDTDNDGHFDKRTIFADGLNLVSGLEVGFGGVWVGAAPNLLFIPDSDGDDKPDGPPEVLLDGWGMQDTHETLNTFRWGPDGWLYGCHGIFVESKVGKPGTPESERTSMNGGVWRYHPKKHRFEVFAHGTSNPWGIDFDENGQCIITACVIPHLWHIIPGGRYQRQAGQHDNPYTYDDIKQIGDHVHYVGANPHAGNARSDSAGGGHAHSGALIYQGDAWPEEYRGSIIMNNIHGARLNRDTLEPKGSGFVGHHAPDFLLANDAWSQLLNFRQGPDGSVYMIDWYDKNQCHRWELDSHDRSNGRIFKVSYKDPNRPGPLPEVSKPYAGESIEKLMEQDLIQMVPVVGKDFVKWKVPNIWYQRRARHFFQSRGLAPGSRSGLISLLENGIPVAVGGNAATRPQERKLDESRCLNILWTLHVTGGLEEEVIQSSLASEHPHVRGWAVRLACEDGDPSSATLAKFAELAKADPSPVVRLELAAAIQRISPENRWDIIEGLVAHAEDVDDHNLPLMDWYALEPLAEVDPARMLAIAESSPMPNLRPFALRRIAAIGTPESIAIVVDAIGHTTDSAGRRIALDAVNTALQGRRRVEPPAGWPAVFASMLNDPDESVQTGAIALGTTFGDARALASLREVLIDANQPPARRAEALAALLKARDPELPPLLLALAVEPSPLQSNAIRGLAAFDQPESAGVLISAYPDLSASNRRDALSTLTARTASAMELLAAVESKTIRASDLTADLIRDLRNLKDDAVTSRIAEVWGAARETPAAKAEQIEKYRAIVRKGYSDAPDPGLGRSLFAKTCGQCHVLFGTGGDVGPELTGSNRADLDYIFQNVVDPSALVGKDYQASVLALNDGRILTGIVKREDPDSITLATANETVVVPATDVEERQLTESSLMPEDQWEPLSDHEIRSLVAYLASPTQVPLRATDESAAAFFNGRDLTGWQGDPALWSVEDGEIVGRTDGLERNEFLRNDLNVGDFRLTLKIKLAADTGNSGVQFRSEPLPEGEIRGYQADVGPGWWGKLYEENARGLLWDRSGEQHVHKGEWNDYEIEAVGSRITTKINGQPCVDLDDPPGARRGVFAFQLHSGGATEVRFKDVRLELIDAPSE